MEKLTIYNNMNKMFPASKESFTKDTDFIEGVLSTRIIEEMVDFQVRKAIVKLGQV